jgi:transcriptional regulator with XRE-family HTH domain
MNDDDDIGRRIRRYRRSRGLSLDQAAGLAGISKPYLSRLERGERSLNSRALLNRISSALQVPVPDLTDQPYVTRAGPLADVPPGVHATRLALLDPSGPAPSEEEIAAGVDGLDLLMNSCDPIRQARVVPDLLRWTQQSALTLDTPAAHERVAIAAYAAVFLMRNLGESDLAWMAAERMRAAAEQTGDPATLGFAAYAQAHALVAAGAPTGPGRRRRRPPPRAWRAWPHTAPVCWWPPRPAPPSARSTTPGPWWPTRGGSPNGSTRRH